MEYQTIILIVAVVVKAGWFGLVGVMRREAVFRSIKIQSYEWRGMNEVICLFVENKRNNKK